MAVPLFAVNAERAVADCPAPTGPYASAPVAVGVPVSDDPLSAAQWGLRQLRVPGAWRQGARGRGATIAIVDTGIDVHHPDLKENLAPGVDVLGAAGAGCNDGPQDHSGHGTAMAGVAAASADNGIGIAGVAPEATLLPVRVGTTAGATVEHLASGIKSAVDRGAEVINVSFGDYPVLGEVRAREVFRPVLEDAWRRGSLVVSSAGNFGAPLCAYPAAGAHVVCVAATDVQETPSVYSNLSTRTEDGGLGVRAPGGEQSCSTEGTLQGIWTTVSLDNDYGAGCRFAGYRTATGTSPAAAAVSGVAALLVARGLSNTEIVDCLSRTSRNPVTGRRGSTDALYGAGIVDAEFATSSCTRTGSTMPADTEQTSAPPSPPSSQAHGASGPAADPPAANQPTDEQSSVGQPPQEPTLKQPSRLAPVAKDFEASVTRTNRAGFIRVRLSRGGRYRVSFVFQGGRRIHRLVRGRRGVPLLLRLPDVVRGQQRNGFSLIVKRLATGTELSIRLKRSP